MNHNLRQWAGFAILLIAMVILLVMGAGIIATL